MTQRRRVSGYGSPTVLDTYELAWAAGLFDGEGSVRARDKCGKRRAFRGLSCSVGQKDRYVLDRLQAALGVGVVHHERRKDGMFVWQVGSAAQVHRVIWMLWPWLSPVKRRQFDTACERYLSLAPSSGGESHN